MKLLLFLSEITIPLLIFCIVGYGLLNRQPVYEEFVEGAKDGFWTVIKIMPTLIGLMVAVGVLRASGLLDCIAQGLGQVTAEIGFPMFLVMSGSMGFGKLAVFAAELALRCRNGEHIVIICGNNAKIERILRKEFHFNKRVHIIGYTNHVSLFMDACDVIYTKPGGLTSTESLVKNIPIVHTAPIPGCETANLHFFGARHLSVSSKHLAKQVQLGKALIENDSLREQMSEAQRRERKPEAAMQIVSLLERLVSHE